MAIKVNFLYRGKTNIVESMDKVHEIINEDVKEFRKVIYPESSEHTSEHSDDSHSGSIPGSTVTPPVVTPGSSETHTTSPSETADEPVPPSLTPATVFDVENREMNISVGGTHTNTIKKLYSQVTAKLIKGKEYFIVEHTKGQKNFTVKLKTNDVPNGAEGEILLSTGVQYLTVKLVAVNQIESAIPGAPGRTGEPDLRNETSSGFRSAAILDDSDEDEEVPSNLVPTSAFDIDTPDMWVSPNSTYSSNLSGSFRDVEAKIIKGKKVFKVEHTAGTKRVVVTIKDDAPSNIMTGQLLLSNGREYKLVELHQADHL